MSNKADEPCFKRSPASSPTSPASSPSSPASSRISTRSRRTGSRRARRSRRSRSSIRQRSRKSRISSRIKREDDGFDIYWKGSPATLHGKKAGKDQVEENWTKAKARAEVAQAEMGHIKRAIEEHEDMGADGAEGMPRLMEALAGWEQESKEAWEAVSEAAAARHENKKGKGKTPAAGSNDDEEEKLNRELKRIEMAAKYYYFQMLESFSKAKCYSWEVAVESPPASSPASRASSPASRRTASSSRRIRSRRTNEVEELDDTKIEVELAKNNLQNYYFHVRAGLHRVIMHNQDWTSKDRKIPKRAKADFKVIENAIEECLHWLDWIETHQNARKAQFDAKQKDLAAVLAGTIFACEFVW
jgi:hypothetical protein